jgi:Fic family protein
MAAKIKVATKIRKKATKAKATRRGVGPRAKTSRPASSAKKASKRPTKKRAAQKSAAARRARATQRVAAPKRKPAARGKPAARSKKPAAARRPAAAKKPARKAAPKREKPARKPTEAPKKKASRAEPAVAKKPPRAEPAVAKKAPRAEAAVAKKAPRAEAAAPKKPSRAEPAVAKKPPRAEPAAPKKPVRAEAPGKAPAAPPAKAPKPPISQKQLKAPAPETPAKGASAGKAPKPGREAPAAKPARDEAAVKVKGKAPKGAPSAPPRAEPDRPLRMSDRAPAGGDKKDGPRRSSAPPATRTRSSMPPSARHIPAIVSLPIPLLPTTKRPSVEERSASIEKRLEAQSEEFRKRYIDSFDMSWIYHDSALEGTVYTFEELRAGLSGQVVPSADSAIQPVCEEIRRHNEAIEFVRDFGTKKRLPVTVDIVRKIYLILHPEEGDLKTVKYRKDVPQHRLYFHEYAPPDKVAYKVRQIVDWLNDPETRKTRNAVRIAARAHYDLLRVYPFPTDSGKVARLFMNLLLLRAGLPPSIIHSTERQRYYEALKGSATTVLQMVQEAVENALSSVEKMLDEHETRMRAFVS